MNDLNDTQLIAAAMKRVDLYNKHDDAIRDALERLHDRSVMLNSVAWRLHKALGDVGPNDQSIESDGDVVALADRVNTRIAALEAAIDAYVATAEDVLCDNDDGWTPGEECALCDGPWPCAERVALDALKEARRLANDGDESSSAPA